MPPAEQYYARTWTTFWEKFMIFLVRMPLTILCCADSQLATLEDADHIYRQHHCHLSRLCDSCQSSAGGLWLSPGSRTEVEALQVCTLKAGSQVPKSHGRLGWLWHQSGEVMGCGRVDCPPRLPWILGFPGPGKVLHAVQSRVCRESTAF